MLLHAHVFSQQSKLRRPGAQDAGGPDPAWLSSGVPARVLRLQSRFAAAAARQARGNEDGPIASTERFAVCEHAAWRPVDESVAVQGAHSSRRLTCAGDSRTDG